MSESVLDTPDADIAPPFALGEEVYVVWGSAFHEFAIPCPMCFGNLFVKLTLGDGQEENVECGFCGLGFEGPRGTVKRHGPSASVRKGRVTGLSSSYGKWRVEVDGSSVDPKNIFRKQVHADTRRLLMFKECEAQAQRNFESQFKNAKGKLAWTAGYHREAIRRLKQQLEWHEARLAVKHSGDRS